MAALATRGTAGLVELHFEVDPESSHDVLVLRGRVVLDRPAFGPGRRALGIGPRIQLELALHATRVARRDRIAERSGPTQPRR